jgi:hypothetical protein
MLSPYKRGRGHQCASSKFPSDGYVRPTRPLAVFGSGRVVLDDRRSQSTRGSPLAGKRRRRAQILR